ncbi:hypothetical protein [Kribbella pratensis]|uniref:Uncharacterized protein n=1 Tax=Kribbella pratensis TaxID=2512112 RepID=A0A4R8C457_9ACTN|nr:hypothetical protein [Kribbella pratensis]TDW70600.1 hypothetical protein EV653_4655 [Kribbella pratensis]
MVTTYRSSKYRVTSSTHPEAKITRLADHASVSLRDDDADDLELELDSLENTWAHDNEQRVRSIDGMLSEHFSGDAASGSTR